MSQFFEELKTGTEQAIDYEKGKEPAKITAFDISPINNYSNSEIRRIRMDANMTQAVFAIFMGVSKKTVEAWEIGRTHPTGSACRLLDILASGKSAAMPFVIRKE